MTAPSEPSGPSGPGGSGEPGNPGPPGGAGPSGASGELQPDLSPQERLRLERREQGLARAVHALERPVLPALGVRCPRCGQRLESADEGKCSRCKVQVRSPEAGLNLVATGGVLGELLRGASYLPRGLLRLARSPRLWKFAVIPLLLNLLVILGTWALAEYVFSPYLSGLSAEWEKGGWGWWALSFVVDAIELLSRWLLPLFAAWLLVAFPPFALLYKLLFMPFMELLTEATDQVALGFKDEGRFELARFYANLVVAIVDALLLTLLQACLFLLLLPINLVPVLGSLVWAVVPPAIFAGMDYSDINLVRRSYTTREKGALWKLHRWRFLGYGVSFFFLLTLPLVNVFVIPAAAVGGALLYLELDRK